MGIIEQPSCKHERMGIIEQPSCKNERMGIVEQPSCKKKRMGIVEQPSCKHERMGIIKKRQRTLFNAHALYIYKFCIGLLCILHTIIVLEHIILVNKST